MSDVLFSPPLITGNFAFFFDLDGTLAEIRSRPDQVYIPAAMRTLLQKLAMLSDGALALISGRSITELDSLVSPFNFPVAGVHGAERRDSHNQLYRTTISQTIMEVLSQQLTSALVLLPGVELETKAMAFALHYRQRPDMEEQVVALARSLIAHFPELMLQPGKCVIELKPRDIDKGSAIRTFMQETPFCGRQPVFIGDDLTDECGFEQVNYLGGISIKVGEGDTQAYYRLANVLAVYRWLGRLTRVLEKNSRGEGYGSFNRRL